jgi:hypothetical protein
MRIFTGSLGVRCGFCHVDNDQASDMKMEKQTARKMVTMVNDINKGSFNGRPQVTCYTCHNGHNDPSNLISLPANEVEEPATRPTYPSADDILSKYVTAIGGEAAVRKVTSRIITGTKEVPTGVTGDRAKLTAQFELYQKAPNLVVSTSKTDKFTLAEGFDGTKAWQQNARGVVTDIPNPYQGRAKRTFDLYESVDLKAEYTRLVVRPGGQINDHDTYVLIGMVNGDSAERLYFDMQSGLLLRKLTVAATPLGNVPSQIDYDDYRDTGGGVKIPFTIRLTPIQMGEALATSSTIHVQKVQDNAGVDASKFTRPASKPQTTAAQGN